MNFSKDETSVELNLSRSEAGENKWLFDKLFTQKTRLKLSSVLSSIGEGWTPKKSAGLCLQKPLMGKAKKVGQRATREW
jgi:hypothetical protein